MQLIFSSLTFAYFPFEPLVGLAQIMRADLDMVLQLHSRSHGLCRESGSPLASIKQHCAEPENGYENETEGQPRLAYATRDRDRKSTRLNSSHLKLSRMPSSA